MSEPPDFHMLIKPHRAMNGSFPPVKLPSARLSCGDVDFTSLDFTLFAQHDYTGCGVECIYDRSALHVIRQSNKLELSCIPFQW